ncbi:hypothetical protein [Alcanivorax sp. 1008]|uniref:hypothetical protein n=1 Tax=Alcanivorax sp. 1008 TaxID=2816853 RepID=UPI001D360F04|nr:hypothetical protein [Alcanivorax sp. 1008]MCC1497986.1 hypothetical protein [Alcanivorax sp. 1008]
MSNDIALRRRAIYTGLKPYMDDDALLDALMHWESHFANAPRFTLQRFVAELCKDADLRSRRADILLSLVQALSMPANSLLPDPLQHRQSTAPAANDSNEGSGFSALMLALFEVMPKDTQYHMRLDMLASLDVRKLPKSLLVALQRWLGDKDTLQPVQCDTALLRAIVNRCYVVLCERVGPVEADRLLARAANLAQENNPTLARAISQLL